MKEITRFYSHRCRAYKSCGWKASSWRSHADQRRRFEAVLELVRPWESIIDVGCGQGDILSYFEPSEYLGIDICPEMIGEARRKFPDRRFLCGDVLETDVGGFDLALAIGTFGLKITDNYGYLFRVAERMLEIAPRAIAVLPDSGRPLDFPAVFFYDASAVSEGLAVRGFSARIDTSALPNEMILTADRA